MMDAVDPQQIKLLGEIMNLHDFDGYYLARGTNLALKYNHRHSIDLDFFIEEEFDLGRSNHLNRVLQSHFGNRFESVAVTDVGVFGFIDNVKTDFVHFPYPLLHDLEMVRNFRLARDIDIAAMKINAINGRGSRKDFYDIHLLLQQIGLSEMLEAYRQKFSVDNVSMALRSLVYFKDAENTQNPNNTVQSLNGIVWGDVKKDITNTVKKFG